MDVLSIRGFDFPVGEPVGERDGRQQFEPKLVETEVEHAGDMPFVHVGFRLPLSDGEREEILSDTRKALGAAARIAALTDDGIDLEEADAAIEDRLGDGPPYFPVSGIVMGVN